MGTLCSILTIRAAFLVIALASLSMVVMTAISGNRPPVDPFAPYADIMPGQLPQKVAVRGFHCQVNIPFSYDESCWLSMKTGIFSKIQVTIAYKTNLVNRVVFILRDRTVTLGDLVLLWGNPLQVIYGQTANFRWPQMHVLTVLQGYNGRFSYWLPITYVAFESTNEK